uniref:Uncharacterized protein n=1 Tax=Tanacetum cinerariifolium TaxID=118510 RepID=A0A6L2JTS7_TANCI|nr:hypothetical protein [Tanacetum cinerariifolium]
MALKHYQFSCNAFHQIQRAEILPNNTGFRNDTYPMVGGPISIVEMVATKLPCACGKEESYGRGWSYDQATVGYTPMHEKVKIPYGHLYDQDQPVGSQSASKVYTKMKENPEPCIENALN